MQDGDFTKNSDIDIMILTDLTDDEIVKYRKKISHLTYDVESENKIMEVVERLAKTKTVILISHRLANVVHADQILVLEDGRISQQGTHGALMAGGGYYSRLYTRQKQLENYSGKAVAQ